MGDSIPMLPEGALSATGLRLADDTTWDECYAYLCSVRVYSRGWEWWLGDLILWADEHGCQHQMVQALAELDFDEKTLANKRWVCSRFSQERRVSGLSFAHHAEVAGLMPHDANTLLGRAVREHWTRSQLRDAVVCGRTKELPAGGKPDYQRRTEALRTATETRPAAPKTKKAGVSMGLQPTTPQERIYTRVLAQSAAPLQALLDLTYDARATPDRVYMAAVEAQRAIEELIGACINTGVEPL